MTKRPFDILLFFLYCCCFLLLSRIKAEDLPKCSRLRGPSTYRLIISLNINVCVSPSVSMMVKLDLCSKRNDSVSLRLRSPNSRLQRISQQRAVNTRNVVVKSYFFKADNLFKPAVATSKA